MGMMVNPGAIILVMGDRVTMMPVMMILAAMILATVIRTMTQVAMALAADLMTTRMMALQPCRRSICHSRGVEFVSTRA
jgi:hypothetical protein